MFRRLIYLRLVQIIIDTLGVYGAFLLAYFVRVGFLFSTDFPFEPFALMGGGATLAWIGFLLLAKYYRIPPRSGERVVFDVLLVLIGGVIAVGILIATYFFNRDIVFSRLLNIYALVLGSGFLLLSQWVFRLVLARKKRLGAHVYRTLIVGANRIGERIIQSIETNPYAPYKIVGVIDPYGIAKTVKGAPLLGKLDKLETLCEKERITSIIQCDGFEHTLNLISLCDEKDIKFQFEPALRGIFEENLRIREVAGINMISFVKRDFSGLKKTRYRLADWILRQVFDVD